MIYFKLGQVDLSKILDIKGRNKAVAANLLPLIVSIGCISYWIISKDTSVLSVVLGVAMVVISFILGVHIQTRAIIESVYRCKEGKNKKIYLKNKEYFDKKFESLARPRRKRHIIKQQGGDNDDVRRK